MRFHVFVPFTRNHDSGGGELLTQGSARLHVQPLPVTRTPAAHGLMAHAERPSGGGQVEILDQP